MAFTEIKKGKFGNGADALKNAIVIYSAGAGTSCVAISGDILAQLGQPSFVKLHIGTAEHAGQLLIRGARANEKGAFKLVYGKNSRSASAKFSISYKKIGMPREKMPATKVSHTVTDDGVIIRLPSTSYAIAAE